MLTKGCHKDGSSTPTAYQLIEGSTTGCTTGVPTKFPELFHLQQTSPELPLRPFDSSRVFFYGYFICQPLIIAYSVNTSFVDFSYSVCIGVP